jgi:hypothetical protein
VVVVFNDKQMCAKKHDQPEKNNELLSKQVRDTFAELQMCLVTNDRRNAFCVKEAESY